MAEMTNDEILALALEQLKLTGLSDKGWTVILDHESDDQFGNADQDTKTITLFASYFPTLDRNIIELIRHEMAHALVGHGKHNLEWWDQLMDLGGRGIWVWEYGGHQQARLDDFNPNEDTRGEQLSPPFPK